MALIIHSRPSLHTQYHTHTTIHESFPSSTQTNLFTLPKKKSPETQVTMSGYSNVGTSGVYEAGDQGNYKDSEMPVPTRYEEGKEHSHQANDSSMFYLRQC